MATPEHEYIVRIPEALWERLTLLALRRRLSKRRLTAQLLAAALDREAQQEEASA